MYFFVVSETETVCVNCINNFNYVISYYWFITVYINITKKPEKDQNRIDVT